MAVSCACQLWSPRTKPSTCAMPAVAPGNMWPGPCSMCMVRGQPEGGLGAHGQPREVFSQGSVCRGQWAQGPGESREDPSARRPHGQAVLQGCRCARCHHHLAEGRGQPPHTGEEIHPARPTGSGESQHLPSAPPTCTSYPTSASSGSHHFQDGGLAPCLFGAELDPNIGSVLASTFPPSAYPRWLALARLPQPLRQLTLLLCGRPGPNTQTSPPWSSQPSRPRMPASTSAWPPAPLAPRRPGSKWSSSQVQGLWGLEVWEAPARALLRPTHSSASTCRCQPPASQD